MAAISAADALEKIGESACKWWMQSRFYAVTGNKWCSRTSFRTRLERAHSEVESNSWKQLFREREREMISHPSQHPNSQRTQEQPLKLSWALSSAIFLRLELPLIGLSETDATSGDQLVGWTYSESDLRSLASIATWLAEPPWSKTNSLELIPNLSTSFSRNSTYLAAWIFSPLTQVPLTLSKSMI